MAKVKPTVEVSNLGMKFNLSQEMHDSLKEFFINLVTRKHMKVDEFWALKDISFKLYPGDRVGILGLNGAGKSTILKAIAGVYHPTEGTVKRRGSLAPLLELGAGFEKEYTARENIYLYGSILGYKKEFIDTKFDEIISFAELEKFVDVPIKNYSSGMRSRLGFAICTAVNPDILILDEVLSVGDSKFRRKSEEKVKSMFEGDVTVLFVSHSLPQVKRICNKAMILDHGRLKAFGDIEDIAPIYEEMTAADPEEIAAKAAKEKRKKAIRRRAARKMRMKDVARLMNNMDLDIEKAMDVLQIPDKVKPLYREGMPDVLKELRIDTDGSLEEEEERQMDLAAADMMNAGVGEES